MWTSLDKHNHLSKPFQSPHSLKVKFNQGHRTSRTGFPARYCPFGSKGRSLSSYWLQSRRGDNIHITILQKHKVRVWWWQRGGSTGLNCTGVVQRTGFKYTIEYLYDAKMSSRCGKKPENGTAGQGRAEASLNTAWSLHSNSGVTFPLVSTERSTFPPCHITMWAVLKWRFKATCNKQWSTFEKPKKEVTLKSSFLSI